MKDVLLIGASENGMASLQINFSPCIPSVASSPPPSWTMGNGAVKARREASKAKRRAAKNSKAPQAPISPPPPPPPPPPSPPPSPREAAINAGADVDTPQAPAATAAKTCKGRATKERKGPHVAPSDRITRFRGVSADTFSAAGAMSKAKAAESKRPQLQETLTAGGDETSSEPRAVRPVRESSVAIRTLLQQISSHPEDSPAYSGAEDEGESSDNGEDNKHNEENYLDGSNGGIDDSGNDDNDDDEVEIVVPKKLRKIAASQTRKKTVQVMMMQEDESEVEDDENGEFDSL